MKNFALSLVVTFAAFTLMGCPDCPPTNSACNSGVGGGSGSGGGSAGGPGDLYTIYTLDPAMSDRFYMDMVVDKTMGTNRVGIAYVSGQGELAIQYSDAGISGGPSMIDYDVR